MKKICMGYSWQLYYFGQSFLKILTITLIILHQNSVWRHIVPCHPPLDTGFCHRQLRRRSVWSVFALLAVSAVVFDVVDVEEFEAVGAQTLVWGTKRRQVQFQASVSDSGNKNKVHTLWNLDFIDSWIYKLIIPL